MLPAVGEHAEKSRGLGASRLKVQPDAGGDTRRRASSNASAVLSRHSWERLELSCCISLQRLTDPAKGVGCSHLARQSSRTHHT